MALVFPRDMTTGLRWRVPKLTLSDRQELSRQAGGVTQGKDLGSPLWRADYTSVPMPLDEADSVMANFRTLRGVINPFYLHPPTRARPVTAVSDIQLTDSSVTVADLRADNRALSLSGLPAGFQMKAGDYLSVHVTDEGREFLQLASGGVANSAGVTPQMDVVPFLRPSVVSGLAVSLVNPMIEMRLEPMSLDDPFDGLSHRFVTFQATQVVR